VLRRLIRGRSDRKHVIAATYSSAFALAAVVTLAWACSDSSGSSSSDDDDNATGGSDASGGKNTGGGANESGGSGDTGGSGQSGTGGAANSDLAVGDFTVELKAPEGSTPGATSFTGRVRNAPLLAADGYVWTLLDESGDCQLTKPEAPFCDPECATGTKCVAADTCREAPEQQDVGTVTVDGLELTSGETQFTVDVQSPNAKLYLPTVKFDYPPCTAGDKLSLQAAGGVYEAFSIDATCIDPLEITTGDVVTLEKGKATTLTWTAPAEPDASKILIEIDISHHGGQTGQINCEVDDTGSFTIPETLTTQLISLGYAGFPDVALTRIAKGYATIEPGRVDFSMVSNVDLPIDIPGLTSCDGDNSNCPNGQECNTAKMICATPCTSDKDCTDATCDTANGYCGQPS
jgi:hypothetical protein